MVPESVTTIEIPWWIFELIIWTLLIAGIIAIAELRASKNPLIKAVIALIAISWCTIFYGSYIEPKILTTEEETITLESTTQTPTTLKVAVVADIHAGPYKKTRWVKKIADKLNELDVEIVIIPGDLIFSKTNQIKYLEPLKDVNHKMYAVLGNHDEHFGDTEIITKTLEEYGIEVLRNDSTKLITHKDQEINMVGIDDIWYTADPQKAIQKIDSKLPTIIIAHNPDFIKYKEAEAADLIISGHTHAGQIRLPKIGAVPPLPTELGKEYDVGLFKTETGQLFISPGVGETGPRARLFNPPKISILNIEFR